MSSWFWSGETPALGQELESPNGKSYTWGDSYPSLLKRVSADKKQNKTAMALLRVKHSIKTEILDVFSAQKKNKK